MAEIDRGEMLLQLCENLRRDNDEWRKAVWKEGRERALRLNDLMQRFEKEYGMLAQEKDLLSQYLPQEEPMPKAVTQGPRNHEPLQRQTR